MAVTVFFFITGYVVYIGYADKVNEPEFGYWVCSPGRVRPVGDRSIR